MYPSPSNAMMLKVFGLTYQESYDIANKEGFPCRDHMYRMGYVEGYLTGIYLDDGRNPLNSEGMIDGIADRNEFNVIYDT